MRLICTLHDQNKAYTLSSYLQQTGIENQLEIVTNTDWGSHEYGSVVCQIWAIEEDQFEEALSISNEFMLNPDDPKYSLEPSAFLSTFGDKPTPRGLAAPDLPTVPKAREGLGAITLYLLITCVMLLFIGEMTRPSVQALPKGIPYTPVLMPPIYKALLYDYPKAFEIVDSLITTYGLKSLESPETLPNEGKKLLDEFHRTPYWEGIYDKILEKLRNPDLPLNFNAPLFEKEQQGELWRLWTPILLHGDIFHLLFNMIWLVVLGRQIEQRIGKWKYIVFIAVAALISNTLQYLMSGADFVGFSGVLVAMLTFVWFRQKHAAWEGYLLERGTMAFITFFIFLMFFISAFAFIYEVTSQSTLALRIANTAHLSGGLVGYLFSKMRYFSWK